jgi:hypothetical protein
MELGIGNIRMAASHCQKLFHISRTHRAETTIAEKNP